MVLALETATRAYATTEMKHTHISLASIYATHRIHLQVRSTTWLSPDGIAAYQVNSLKMRFHSDISSYTYPNLLEIVLLALVIASDRP
jgi:hypothetical protein